MRKLAFLLLLAAVGPQAPAQARVTVDQVDQLLATLHHERDAAAARRLAALQLTERASSAKLAQWLTGFQGDNTRKALLALADASAFLDLPTAQSAVAPAPDMATQNRMIAMAGNYVRTILHKLPNFSALRSTTRFEVATPEQLKQQQDWLQFVQMKNIKLSSRTLGPVDAAGSSGARLYLLGSSSNIVTYRDEREVVDTRSAKDGGLDPPVLGVITMGEFGPILWVVMGDASHGTITWGHWEPGAGGPIAVFRYAVPKEMSHNTVSDWTGNDLLSPAYHGEIAIDPADGTILRLTLQSELRPFDPLSEEGIMVEYGPVEIGERTYICPVRGVAVSKPTRKDPQTEHTPPVVFVNDVSFTQYHVFRAETRILP